MLGAYVFQNSQKETEFEISELLFFDSLILQMTELGSMRLKLFAKRKTCQTFVAESYCS